jgi:ubiquinone/menaquinone biosynthesis C-methylase UbiE
MGNFDQKTISGFGDEWARFTQDELKGDLLQKIYNDYFSIFPWELLPSDAEGIDVGCGSGRWAQLVAPRVRLLHLVDASKEALDVARQNLRGHGNVDFYQARVDKMPFDDNSMDFAYSLGVLHHLPDTDAAIRSVVAKIKPGAPILIYLYYAFDNRPVWYRYLWRVSNTLRFFISRLPYFFRYVVSQLIACVIYWPLSRFAYLFEKLSVNVLNWPLCYYRDKSFYVMRTDALDRFGTQLEKRFTRTEITSMLEKAGLVKIIFSGHSPYWCVVGIKG